MDHAYAKYTESHGSQRGRGLLQMYAPGADTGDGFLFVTGIWSLIYALHTVSGDVVPGFSAYQVRYVGVLCATSMTLATRLERYCIMLLQLQWMEERGSFLHRDEYRKGDFAPLPCLSAAGPSVPPAWLNTRHHTSINHRFQAQASIRR